MSTIADQLELLFKSRDYKWRLNGELRHPTTEDIQFLLDSIKKTLDNDPDDNLQLEVGRMIVRKDSDHLDLYVYMGEI